MVKTRRSKEPNPTNYWKLLEAATKEEACRLLDSKGAKYLKSIPAFRAKQLHLRAQRDLLIYDRCSFEELQNFCIARKIQPDVPKSRSRKAKVHILVARLEVADETATFKRFLDLPPELRLLVYGHYFADTCALLRSQAGEFYHYLHFDFTEPPITKTSSLLRRESLPEFYDHFEYLTLVYHHPPPVPRPIWNTRSLKLIPKASQEVLNRLQHITFAGNLNIRHGPLPGGLWEVVIELKTGEFKVKVSERFGWNPSPGLYGGREPIDVHGAMERRARQFVEDRQQNGESRVTLRVNDAAAVEKLFEPLE